MRLFLIIFFSFTFCTNSFTQGCCSGGGGSPIAGGAAAGVLQENQMEVSINYQYNNSSKFFNEEVILPKNTIGTFNNLRSDYLFLRVDYGVSKKLTLSIASGYFLKKMKVEIDNIDTISTRGFGDLIIFPRYSIYNSSADFKRTEIALGLGLKIPLGINNDSSLTGPNVWDFYKTNPPTVQTTTGSNDLMFYLFFFREYQKRKLRIFMTTLHVNKSFNSLGVKFGDYTSIGFFASKTFFQKWGITTQIKAEKIGQIKAAKNIDLVGNYDLYRESTGSKKWFFIPQISYSQNGITVFATSEIPLYQYLNGMQVGSQHQFTIGVNYRFLTKECEREILPLPK